MLVGIKLGDPIIFLYQKSLISKKLLSKKHSSGNKPAESASMGRIHSEDCD